VPEHLADRLGRMPAPCPSHQVPQKLKLLCTPQDILPCSSTAEALSSCFGRDILRSFDADQVGPPPAALYGEEEPFRGLDVEDNFVAGDSLKEPKPSDSEEATAKWDMLDASWPDTRSLVQAGPPDVVLPQLCEALRSITSISVSKRTKNPAKLNFVDGNGGVAGSALLVMSPDKNTRILLQRRRGGRSSHQLLANIKSHLEANALISA